MIPKIIHIIWLGDPPPDVATEAVEHWRKMGNGREVILHRDVSLLWPAWQAAFDSIQSPKPLVTQCDLLRHSLLRQFGGWYFDCDLRATVTLDDIEAAYPTPDHKMFVTSFGTKNSFLSTDLLATTPAWLGWPLLDEYIASPPFGQNYFTYCISMLAWVRAKSPTCFRVGPPDRFALKHVALLRDLIIRRNEDKDAQPWLMPREMALRDLKSGGCPHGSVISPATP